MSDLASTRSWALPPPRAEYLDAVCDRFEAAWKLGGCPRLEDFLGETPEAERAPLVVELLRVEVAYRRKKGQSPALADYLVRFPDQAHVLVPLLADDHLASAPTRSAPSLPSDLASFDRPSVPGYEILERLGGGGMGVVWKARHLGLDRIVAVKMIRAGDGGAQAEARFRQEAKTIASIDHPHVLRVYDYGTCKGQPYLAMEFAEGGTLSRRLANGPMPEVEAAALVETLALAMHAVHKRQIIHRDLKPDNILLTTEHTDITEVHKGTGVPDPASFILHAHPEEPWGHLVPKIADFGLAKLLDQAGLTTVSGLPMGTPGYMAPEQAAGRTGEISTPADVYGLGAVLYACLTGRPPFKHPKPEVVIAQVLLEDPPPPTRFRPDLASDLEAVCLKCLEREIGDRYASGAELAGDLRRFLAGEGVLAQPLPEWERQARWARGAGYLVEDVLTYGVRDVVYKAREIQLDRIVALKVIALPAQAEPGARERLLAQARTIAGLEHANIVGIHNVGQHAGQPYVAYKFIEGGSLIDRFQDKPQPPREAAELVKQVALALQHAHDRGVVHGALKPSNILLTADGQPKITSFGLGMLRGRGDPDRPAYRKLSSYLAPELAEGSFAGVGPAADVYALGAVLYKLLTGGPPFLADSVQATLEQVRSQEPVPPSRLQSDVPSELDVICLKCLHKEASQRYPSAAQLARELSTYLTRRPTLTEEVELIPGYEFLEKLGEGGSGIVHKALQISLNRPVALKVFHERRRRFLEANRAVAQLKHANIVAVYDSGERDGRLYVAEELVEGKTLDQHLAGQPQPPTKAARLIETLARALHHTHQHGIVHRNLKPRVVLLDRFGVPKVSSFDLAQLTNVSLDERDEPGVLRGTAAYFAPEQFTGRPEEIGPATDVYGLGLILYELLTGNRPFRAEKPGDLMKQVVFEAPAPPRRLRLEVPRDLDAICLRCLAKAASDRYPSAQALADDLRCYLTGRPTNARPVGMGERLVYWARRHLQPPEEADSGSSQA